MHIPCDRLRPPPHCNLRCLALPGYRLNPVPRWSADAHAGKPWSSYKGIPSCPGCIMNNGHRSHPDMTSGVLGIIGCPMLEDNLIHCLRNDPEEKDIAEHMTPEMMEMIGIEPGQDGYMRWLLSLGHCEHMLKLDNGIGKRGLRREPREADREDPPGHQGRGARMGKPPAHHGPLRQMQVPPRRGSRIRKLMGPLCHRFPGPQRNPAHSLGSDDLISHPSSAFRYPSMVSSALASHPSPPSRRMAVSS